MEAQPNHKTLPIWVKRVRLLNNATPTRVIFYDNEISYDYMGHLMYYSAFIHRELESILVLYALFYDLTTF